MKIARVFPTKTTFTPADPDAYVGMPPIIQIPEYDQVHISVAFTWDIPKAKEMVKQWRVVCPVVKIWGPAIDGESRKPFVAGQYLREGITITSRGCPNSCHFCMVSKGLIEFNKFPVGNIVQDNNFLACSKRHQRLVFKMLKTQRRIEFKGGLDKHRISTKIADELRGLSVDKIYLACDPPYELKSLSLAVAKLRAVGFTRHHLYCYVLCG